MVILKIVVILVFVRGSELKVFLLCHLGQISWLM